METVAFILPSGKEIIGTVLKQDALCVSLTKARIVLVQPMQDNENGQMTLGVSFMPFMASNPDATIRIYKTHLVSDCDLSREMETAYLSHISSIQLLG